MIVVMNVICGLGIFGIGMLLGSYLTQRSIEKIIGKEIDKILDAHGFYAVKKDLDT